MNNAHFAHLPGSMDATNYPSPTRLMCTSNTFIPGTWVIKAGENFDYGGRMLLLGNKFILSWLSQVISFRKNGVISIMTIT